MSVSIGWLIGGAILIALEAFGLPGIGFLFAGIAAILTGLLIEFGLLPVEQVISHWAVFFLATILSAALLWKKLKHWRMKGSQAPYQNMVGDEASVTGGGLREGHTGNVRWSGTIMKAKLQPGAGEVKDGATVIITAVEGNILTVKPR